MHESAPIGDDEIYKATLLDVDNRILSTGEARFYTGHTAGVFWPQEPADEDLLLKKAATVQTSMGHVLSILTISRCPAGFPPVAHYDFRYQLPVL